MITKIETIQEDQEWPLLWTRYIYIEEKNIVLNLDLKNGERIESKWFCEPRKIHDFPNQGFQTILMVKKRRRIIRPTNVYIPNEIEFKMKGTNATKRYVDYLKSCWYANIPTDVLSKLTGLPETTIEYYQSCF